MSAEAVIRVCTLQMGGPEMLIHHIAAFISVGLASYTKQAHMYTLLLLSTEMTTPFVNARWILDQMVGDTLLQRVSSSHSWHQVL